MLNALGELIFEAIQKQIAERQDAASPGGGVAPLQGLPMSRAVPVRAAQVTAPVASAPVAKPPVPMGRIPDAPPADFFPTFESAVPVAPAFTNPLLEALRGGPALIGGIVVAQVLGPPASLRPHSAPTDTL
jgi:hypothetical protein